MAAGKPKIQGFDPTDAAQVAELRRPDDAVNNVAAEADIHPADPMFGTNGTLLRGMINGRGQVKFLGNLRKLDDIQNHVRSWIRDIQKHAVATRMDLARQLRDDDGILNEEEKAQKQTELNAASKLPVFAFQVTCKAPFRSAKAAADPTKTPITVNTYAVVKEFASRESVKKLNEEMEPLQCRWYPGARADMDVLYTPKWTLL